METSLFSFDGVSKQFEDSGRPATKAVEDISFSVKEGEIVSVLGPSGCGKTTLLRLAAGLEMPTTGTVHYRGQPITGPSPERGIVFQAYNAFPWLTVAENVAFGLKENRQPSESEVLRWLYLAGVRDFADAYPKALSGGMRQRMALARTLIVRPRLTLLDEPFGALDERTRDGMQQLLVKVVEEACSTVLIVTHDIREALMLSDRLVVLSTRPGRVAEILCSETPRPRTRDFQKSLEFEDLYGRILARFPDESNYPLASVPRS